ncbi:hypothetical protein EMIHUDRAFT_438489, partial [Emiliania huxleyi CCMP1516]|uniref:Uncharacterized protein n=2 Tax=Emiliania huxleyi TaxID=2903 RepID=A0A0D3I8V1_EMIH1
MGQPKSTSLLSSGSPASTCVACRRAAQPVCSGGREPAPNPTYALGADRGAGGTRHGPTARAREGRVSARATRELSARAPPRFVKWCILS